ncbi:MAG: hypothetical protein R3F51_16385 [Cyanobacteriota/Melainabacteria group bacterium]
MFFLARQIELSRIASIFAALTIAFCPYMQWYLELLGSGYCLTPLLFYCFVRAAQNLDLKSSIPAAILSALIVLSGHPEVSFCGIFAACVLFFCTVSMRGGEKSLAKHLIDGFKILFFTGVTAFCLSAPMLLPTLEFILNGESYKFGVGNAAYISWQALVLNLVQPVNGAASPYLGLGALIFLPLVLISRERKFMLPYLILYIFFAGLTSKLPPFNYLYLIKPFNFVVATYFTPIMLSFGTITAAIGFDALINNTKNSDRRIWIAWIAILTVGLSAILLRPFLLSINFPFEVCKFDMAFPPSGPEKFLWNWQVFCAIGIIALSLPPVIKRERFKHFAAVIVVLISFSTGMLACSSALPIRVNFDFPEPEPLPEIISSGQRMIATGPHLFKPNINQIYAVRDLRFLNALFPKRFLSFVEKAGARITSYKVEFDLPVSPLIRLASVSNILTKGAVFDTTSVSKMTFSNKPLKNALALSQGIKLISIESEYSPADKAIFGRLNFELREPGNTLSFRPLLMSRDTESILYMDDFQPISNSAEAGKQQITLYFSVPVSESLKANSALACLIEFQDSTSGEHVLPACELERWKEMLVIQNLVATTGDTTKSKSAFRLIKESSSGLRLYKNRLACPDAFLVHKIKIVDTAEAALSEIQKEDFNPAEFAVIERSEKSALSLPTVQEPSSAPEDPVKNSDSLELEKSGASKVVVRLNQKEAGLLILSEINYPGWKAFLDDREVPVINANYAFRAVFVPAGSHSVLYKYSPDSFKAGLALFALGLLMTLAAALSARLKQRLLRRLKD